MTLSVQITLSVPERPLMIGKEGRLAFDFLDNCLRATTPLAVLDSGDIGAFRTLADKCDAAITVIETAEQGTFALTVEVAVSPVGQMRLSEPSRESDEYGPQMW